MILSYSEREIYSPDFEDHLIEQVGADMKCIRAKLQSTERILKGKSIPYIQLYMWDEDSEKSLLMGLDELRCKQILAFLQSHLSSSGEIIS